MIGRPRKEFAQPQVEALRQQGWSWERIAEALGVHRNTLLAQRRDVAIVDGAATSKQCNGCYQTLPVDLFSIDRSRRDGRNIRCRQCVSRQWKENNSTPCVDCGSPRRALTPGQCRRCYQMTALLRNKEHEILNTIPRLIADTERQFREFTKSLNNAGMGKSDRLMAVLTWKPERLNN